MKLDIIILPFLITIVQSAVGQYNFGAVNQARFNEQYTNSYDDEYSEKEETGVFSDTALYGQNTFSINGQVYIIYYTADKNGFNPQFILTRVPYRPQSGTSPIAVRVGHNPSLVASLLG